ncbi:amino acid deaminase [Xaviernesmea oryzae]|uniref:Amino acid deaminase n=1 Tax=Xaviernesmea oryzae TaxID=464029 RepID=A0A1Q9AYQ9_9HYPH|nr:alanine racemase [Xaviernesmea oryzae]OLP60561.1 amino acid deaminase [Xaviernesmea oryzae]SEM31101.1 D-serine dehydratase [Xaviernesmea oryzae]
MSDAALNVLTDPMIDDRIRGFPPGHPPLPAGAIGAQNWAPYDGRMALPLLSLDEAAFAGNVETMMAYVRDKNVDIAPHAKTPMVPALADALVKAGAWGTTVADIRQAGVLLRAGQRRLILANEIGGVAAARRLAALLAGFPDADLHIFVDSPEAVEALRTAWAERDDLPPLGLLIEFGAGRAGARTIEAGLRILERILASETTRFRLTGVAAYEGAAATADVLETAQRIDALMQVTGDFLALLRTRLGKTRALILTAGGSVFFDRVMAGLRAAVAADPHCRLILRSGAVFFHDHGVYERGMAGVDARGGFVIGGETLAASEAFQPALRVWAEVLSRPEPDLAICGLGLRDVANDQGLPRPLALYRAGERLATLHDCEVLRLNDQHAFLRLDPASTVSVGDVIVFGISHPCTCLDRHAILYGLDPDQRVTGAYLTCFG